ncbi:hypothetical protein DL93DRAFT_2083414 [Clavulina sp. PMI_390]|nr:hypothetical protein DL93DRAFT_2083414 [Clavulina sp. PMI_390]
MLATSPFISCHFSTPERVASAVLDSLPHLQHVKLQIHSSFVATDFRPVVEALHRQPRLESLDITGVPSSFLCTGVSASEWSSIGAHLNALRLTLNQTDRVENRRNPVFQTLVSSAARLQALELAGMQAARDVTTLLAAVQHPDMLIDLKITASAGQTLSSFAPSLNRFSAIQELSVSFSGGFESICNPSKQVTLSRNSCTESLKRVGIELNALSHLTLSCSEQILSSLGLECASDCICDDCSNTTRGHFQWSKPSDFEFAPLTTNPFVPFVPTFRR